MPKEKCKKHHKPLLKCKDRHYDGAVCDCFPQCEVCVRVNTKAHQKSLSKCNIVAQVSQDPSCRSMSYNVRLTYLKYKPRQKLKKGDYAVLDMKTGYLVKAVDQFVQFIVVK